MHEEKGFDFVSFMLGYAIGVAFFHICRFGFM